MKMLCMFKRRADLTHEQFREYYETQHAVLSARLYPFLKDYRRNYMRQDMRATGATNMATPPGLHFDVVTEVSFHSQDDFQRMLDILAVPATREAVIVDEEQFMDRSATLVYFVDESVTQFPTAAAA